MTSLRFDLGITLKMLNLSPIRFFEWFIFQNHDIYLMFLGFIYSAWLSFPCLL